MGSRFQQVYPAGIKEKAIQLRKKGYAYGDIAKKLGYRIPKATVSTWCSGVQLPANIVIKKKQENLAHLVKIRAKAVVVNRMARQKYLASIKERNCHFTTKLEDSDTSKVALSMLYLAEGSKNMDGSLCFGNSDPGIIRLFLKLLRKVYIINENKFRCTLQCRADNNISELEQFWSELTKISRLQFYKARIDPRTIGKPSIKSDYKGVCRIEYFSAEVYLDIMSIADTLMGH